MIKILSLFFTFLLVPIFSFADSFVFMKETEEFKQIAIFENGELKELTPRDWISIYPDISPDGENLVYVSGRNTDSLSLKYLSLKTGESKSLIEEGGFLLHPKFSQNGKIVFFSISKEGKQKIAKLDLRNDKKELAILDIGGGDLFFPVPSSDASFLVFQRNIDRTRKIVEKNLTTGEEIELVEGMSPSISKEDRYIAYSKKIESHWQVFVFDRISKKHLQVTEGLASSMAPSFDRDLNIYFSREGQNGNLDLFEVKFSDWKKSSRRESILLEDSRANLYSVRFSGDKNIEQKSLENIPGSPRSSFGSIEHGNNIYVCGGHRGAEHTYPKESFTDELNVYNIEKEEWNTLSPRPSKAHGYSLAANGNYIYAFGGFAFEESTKPQWKSLSYLDRFNIEKNEWDKRIEMPRKRSSNVVVRVKDKVYIIGGWDSTPKFSGDYDGIFHDEIDVFDLKTEKFSTLDVRLPKKRRAFTALVSEEKIYLIGGIGVGASHFELLDEVTEFDPEKMEFSEKAKLPYPSFAPAAGVLNGKLFLFGGMIKIGEWDYEYVSHIYSLDFSESLWRNTGRFLKESKGFAQVVGHGDYLNVLGGHSYQDNSDQPVSSVERFSLIETSH